MKLYKLTIFLKNDEVKKFEGTQDYLWDKIKEFNKQYYGYMVEEIGEENEPAT